MWSLKSDDITMLNVQVVFFIWIGQCPLFLVSRFVNWKHVSHTSTSILISNFLTLSINVRPQRNFWYFYAIPSWSWSCGCRTFGLIFLICESTVAPLIINPFAPPHILPYLYFHRRFIEPFCASTFCMYMYYWVSTFQELILHF